MLKGGMGVCGKTLMKLGTLSPNILVRLPCQRKRSPLPTSEGINAALSEETVMDSPEIVATETMWSHLHHPVNLSAPKDAQIFG